MNVELLVGNNVIKLEYTCVNDAEVIKWHKRAIAAIRQAAVKSSDLFQTICKIARDVVQRMVDIPQKWLQTLFLMVVLYMLSRRVE